MKSKLNAGALLVGTLAAALLGGCATTSTEVTQKWSYNQGTIATPGDSGGGGVSRNTLVLTRPFPGSPTGRMKLVGALVEPCFAGGVDARLEYTADSMIIYPGKGFRNCPDYRITIRNDGQGGSIDRKHPKVTAWSVYTDDPGLLPR